MWRFWFILLSSTFSTSVWTAETTTPPLNEALRVLLGQTVVQSTPQAQPAIPQHGAVNAHGRSTVVVKRGETLARIVRVHFKSSPFREDFIYKAFVQLNPEAFPRKTHHVLNAGASLQVPTHADLMAMAEGAMPASGEAVSVRATPSGGSTAQHKNWVRFP
jgi:Tfp pilus assembly protein FimV